MKRILVVVLILALRTGSALATNFNGDGTEDIAVFRGSTDETEMVADPGDKWSTSFSAQSVIRVYMNVTVPNGPGTYAQLIVSVLKECPVFCLTLPEFLLGTLPLGDLRLQLLIGESQFSGALFDPKLQFAVLLPLRVTFSPGFPDQGHPPNIG